jgi:CBS domain-containing protein
MFRMVDNDIGAVVVVNKGRPVGIITERNVLERVLVRNLNVYQTQAKDVMSTPLVSIGSDRPIKEALDLMRQQNIRRLAVTENDALVGLVTERRLLSGFLSQVY